MSEPLQRVIAAEEAAARELATVPDWIWDGETLPVPIERICDSHYGLLIEEHEDLTKVARMPTETHLSGLLFPDTREVWINVGEARVRRRFTVGHELGHWVLHCARGVPGGGALVHCRGSEVREEAAGDIDPAESYLNYPPDELDANQFAAALLMPARLLRERLVSTALPQICNDLLVSHQALTRRLWYLGIAAG